MEQNSEKLSTAISEASSVILTKEAICQYCDDLQSAGRKDITCKKYRKCLEDFWKFLPGDKTIVENSLRLWKEDMISRGLANRTITFNVNVINGYLESVQCWSYCVREPSNLEPVSHPILTRAEYLRLLSTARILGDERSYFIIKLLVTTGIKVPDIPKVTVEAVKKGYIRGEENGDRVLVRFPKSLQAELSAYVKEQNILSGPLFVTRYGNNVSRENIFRSLHRIGKAACVDENKLSPTCMRNLFKQTYDVIFAQVEAQAQQRYEKLLEDERIALQI